MRQGTHLITVDTVTADSSFCLPLRAPAVLAPFKSSIIPLKKLGASFENLVMLSNVSSFIDSVNCFPGIDRPAELCFLGYEELPPPDDAEYRVIQEKRVDVVTQFQGGFSGL
jgi:hypothetical protein